MKVITQEEIFRREIASLNKQYYDALKRIKELTKENHDLKHNIIRSRKKGKNADLQIL